MNHFFDRTKITFHRGNAFAPDGIDKKPFATFIINDLAERELIDAVCALVREHTNKMHAECCNIKLTSEDWDC